MTETVRYCVNVLREESALRRFKKLLNETTALCESRELSVPEILSEHWESVRKTLRYAGKRSLTRTTAEIADQVLDVEQYLPKNRIQTGLEEIDFALKGGMRKGQLIILAGRPSMGKTTLGLQICGEISMHGRSAVFVTREVPDDQLFRDLSQNLLQIDVSLEEAVEWGRSDIMDKYAGVARDIRDMPLTICMPSTPNSIEAELDAHAHRYGEAEVVFVDYVQRLDGDGKHRSRYDELSEISKRLKQIALERQLTMVAMSQLNREVEHRENKRPRMSDLKGSGDFEQDADVIGLLYRHEYYNPGERVGQCEVILGKVRHGKVGRCLLGFDAPKKMFYNRQGDL